MLYSDPIKVWWEGCPLQKSVVTLWKFLKKLLTNPIKLLKLLHSTVVRACPTCNWLNENRGLVIAKNVRSDTTTRFIDAVWRCFKDFCKMKKSFLLSFDIYTFKNSPRNLAHFHQEIIIASQLLLLPEDDWDKLCKRTASIRHTASIWQAYSKQVASIQHMAIIQQAYGKHSAHDK